MIDWPPLAAGSPVLVIYMAIKHLATIRARLFDGGRHPDEPVAVGTAVQLCGQYCEQSSPL